MIEEVQVINNGGIPLFYHGNDDGMDESYMLQASFITALTQFATEMKNGQVKSISMERKNYLLTKTGNFIMIFASSVDDMDHLTEYRPQLQEASDYLDTKLLQLNINVDFADDQQLDKTFDEFNKYLLDNKLIEDDSAYDSSRFRSNVNNLVFRSVGYEPGKCNIGRAERMKRLAFGMTFFSISGGLFAIMLLVEFPRLYRLILVVPNFLGFLGLLQYFYRFCTTNALNETYDMH